VGICELCGSDRVGVHRTRASGASVEACSRCIDRLGLELPPTRSPPPKQPSQARPRRNKQNDIMAKGEKELASNFHQRIREARKEKGWDQREFARRMNERLNIVQRTENGNRPTDALLKKIEKVLGIDLFVDVEPTNTRSVSSSGSRGMTIGDVYDDLLSRRE
jgi:uncharacterized protein (TIGR00270 family)